LSLVVRRPQSKQKASLDEPIDQLDSAVVLELHSFRQHADGRSNAFGQTSNSQQELVLLRLDARLSRGILAETEETADLVAQFRHSFEIGLNRCLWHIYR
jgi:hypothetical protein